MSETDDDREPEAEITHLSPFKLLPPKPGVCQVCATDHDPGLPHNQPSLFYQYSFYGQHGRWPTWDDAMVHCTEDVRTMWRQALSEVLKEDASS